MAESNIAVSIEPKQSAVVLLSSGLDSTVNLYAAQKYFSKLFVLTFNYGQRAAAREVEQSRLICKELNLESQVLELPWFKKLTQTSLVNSQAKVPMGHDVQINNLATSQKTAQAVWVPNRNGVFLNVAAAFAESQGANFVIPGFNLEEATTFPDNSKAFISALDHSFSFSTANQVKVRCFTTDMDKTEIVKFGKELNVPFQLIWPCYFGGAEICKACESCQRYIRAVGGQL